MILSLFQYAFVAPVQPGDKYSEYDRYNRYKNCHYVGLFRGTYNSEQSNRVAILYYLCCPGLCGQMAADGYDKGMMTHRGRNPQGPKLFGIISRGGG